MVTDLKTLPNKGCKIARQKRLFLGEFCLSEQDFFYLCCVMVFLAPLPGVQCPKILNFKIPQGKVMEINGLRFENFCS